MAHRRYNVQGGTGKPLLLYPCGAAHLTGTEDSIQVDEPQELQELRRCGAATRAKRASELVAYYQDLVNECSRIRKEALTELVAEGQTQRELANLLRMTRTRVGQLLSSGPTPERALLGTGALTIAVGGKPEGPRVNPSTVVSVEATKARDLIADAATSYDLTVTHEVVAPPGLVNLNRSNLIVIGSPRLLPFVAQVLESDSHLGFSCGAQGWYLTEGTTIHRSPSDRGEPADYAYLGRLPRPDSKGTFLYLAGIHAMGTLGAATYLTSHVAELYQQIKNRRWSMLIECRYDPDTRKINSTAPITSIYTN